MQSTPDQNVGATFISCCSTKLRSLNDLIQLADGEWPGTACPRIPNPLSTLFTDGARMSPECIGTGDPLMVLALLERVLRPAIMELSAECASTWW
jgi:hypothetical protein